VVTLTPEICRAARALLALAQRELGQRAGVSHPTIANFEMGDRRPYERTLRDLVAAFEAAGVVFIEPREGVHRLGIALSWDVEPPTKIMKGKAEGAADGSKDGLDAFGWDWDEDEPAEDDEPVPPLDWTDEDRVHQIEHWRAQPEKWAALHEVSRECLLRAMGVASLDQSAPGQK
jgi:transcriptional regulator with XRE-family HTH domain